MTTDCCCYFPWSFNRRLVSAGSTHRSLTSDGLESWRYNHGANTLRCVFIDAAGNVVVGGDPGTDGYTVRYHNSAGDLLWSATIGVRPRGIAIGPTSGNVYLAGDRSSGETVWALDSSGNLLWSADHGNNVFGMCIDSSENVYTVGNQVGFVSIRKYDSAGVLLASPTTFGGGVQISVDGAGNVYHLTGAGILKYDSTFVLQWTTGFSGVGICCQHDAFTGDVYVGTGAPTANLRRYASTTGTLVTSGSWPLTIGAPVNDIDVNSVGDVYAAHADVSGKTIQKFDNTGASVWSFDHNATCTGVSVNSANKVGFCGQVATS